MKHLLEHTHQTSNKLHDLTFSQQFNKEGTLLSLKCCTAVLLNSISLRNKRRLTVGGVYILKLCSRPRPLIL